MLFEPFVFISDPWNPNWTISSRAERNAPKKVHRTIGILSNLTNKTIMYKPIDSNHIDSKNELAETQQLKVKSLLVAGAFALAVGLARHPTGDRDDSKF